MLPDRPGQSVTAALIQDKAQAGQTAHPVASPAAGRAEQAWVRVLEGQKGARRLGTWVPSGCAPVARSCWPDRESRPRLSHSLSRGLRPVKEQCWSERAAWMGGSLGLPENDEVFCGADGAALRLYV